MRFIVDESTGPVVARWLRERGHDVFSVYEEARGADDDSIIRTASAENRILITNDRDFGEKVHRDQMSHHGVVLLRLEDERVTNKVRVLEQLLEHHSERLSDRFVVVTESRVRFSER